MNLLVSCQIVIAYYFKYVLLVHSSIYILTPHCYARACEVAQKDC